MWMSQGHRTEIYQLMGHPYSHSLPTIFHELCPSFTFLSGYVCPRFLNKKVQLIYCLTCPKVLDNQIHPSLIKANGAERNKKRLRELRLLSL